MQHSSDANGELPGMMEVAKRVHEQRWPHTMDAQQWAAEFVKVFPGIEEGTMLGWFANAIMAGYDTARARAALPATPPTTNNAEAQQVSGAARPGGGHVEADRAATTPISATNANSPALSPVAASASNTSQQSKSQMRRIAVQNDIRQLPCPTCPNPPSCAEYGDCQLSPISETPAKDSLKAFAARCRPAVKGDLMKSEQLLLKGKDGTFAPHYLKSLEHNADRARRLLDEIDALIGSANWPDEPPIPPHHIPVA